MNTRKYWCEIAFKLGFPVLNAFANQEFKKQFLDNKPTAPLEALCRTLAGLAPWIELNVDKEAIQLGELARQALDNITNPACPDYIDFSVSEQTLVEGAILCQALIRGEQQLWNKVSKTTKYNIIQSLRKTRSYTPHDNNWVLFPSMIEAFFMKVGEVVEHRRLLDGICQYMKWYVGDGLYGDGEELHFDYYNSFKIQPMLSNILLIVKHLNRELQDFSDHHDKRLQRWATIQERMIAPNGSFPPIGRSITYRGGAFQGLALCALENNLPPSLKPGQVRVALTRVIKATLENPDTFENGWLTKGLFGNQPSLAEPYINHGSLYMCSTIFLPLGLRCTASFWTDKDSPTTWEILERGDNLFRDKPYTECVRKVGKCV